MYPIAKLLLSWFFPVSCLTCGSDLSNLINQSVCARCLSALRRSRDFVLSQATAVDAFHPGFEYEGVGRELMRAFKYGGKCYLAPLLLTQSIRFSNFTPDPGAILVPVPMPYWRETMRGYNQTVLLAEEIGRRFNAPIATGLLKRRYSPSQTSLSRAARRRNALKSFAAGPAMKRSVPAHCLLIDDIATSGATLNACALLLKKGGARRVSAFVVSRDSLRRDEEG